MSMLEKAEREQQIADAMAEVERCRGGSLAKWWQATERLAHLTREADQDRDGMYHVPLEWALRTLPKAQEDDK